MTLEERWAYFQSFSSTLRGVNVTWSPATGFGFKLLKDVNQKDCVVKLPMNYAVTSADVYALTPFLSSDFNAMEQLAVRIAYEKLLPKSNHHAKLLVDSLPTDQFHMFQYWTEEDFEVLDRYTLTTLETSTIVRVNVTRLQEKLVKALGQAREAPAQLLDLDILSWAVGIVMSRSYLLVDKNMKTVINHSDFEGPISCMFPIFDLMNHFPVPTRQKPTQPTTFMIFSDEIPQLCYLVPFAQKKGREFYGSYGDKPNTELISLYGFAFERNPDDKIVLETALSPYCKGKKRANDRCEYVTTAAKTSAGALIDALSSTTNVNFDGKVTFGQVMDTIRRDKSIRKQAILGMLGYRNEVMRGITQGSVRELRRLKRKCESYRCELIYTLLISQRVDRYLHTERIDRRTLELLLLDLY